MPTPRKTSNGVNYWLFKSEPSCYSIDDLKRDKVEPWDGVRNYQARNFMRAMKAGDRGLFYHSSTNKVGVVGTVTIAKEAYPDPTQFDPKSEHPDPKSDPAKPRWDCVDVKFDAKLTRLVELSEIKADRAFASMRLIQKGNRLSIMPIEKKHYELIVNMSESNQE